MEMNNDRQKSSLPECASCKEEYRDKFCVNERGKASKRCPTTARKEILSRANVAYTNKAVGEFARQASIQEAECYANRQQRPYVMQPAKTRIVEICEFAGRMGYIRLGLAFCIGLAREAAVVEEILKHKEKEIMEV